MRKEAIHHVQTATTQDQALLHGLHAIIQLAAGHYSMLGQHQTPITPGVDLLTFVRSHEVHGNMAHEPDLTFAQSLLDSIKAHVGKV